MNMFPKKIIGICLGQWFLAVSLVVFLSFTVWLFADTEQEKVFVVYDTYVNLVLEGKREDANLHLKQSLASVKGDNMDVAWLPLVRLHRGGYELLEYFRRILIAEPDRKNLYAEIAGLIESAPQSFQEQVKQRYLADIRVIPNIRVDYLEEFGLLVKEQE